MIAASIASVAILWLRTMGPHKQTHTEHLRFVLHCEVLDYGILRCGDTEKGGFIKAFQLWQSHVSNTSKMTAWQVTLRLDLLAKWLYSVL